MRTGSSRRFRRWRRIAGAAQALAVLGLPFVSVGGESALRLDVPAGRLHAFGASFAIDEAFVVLAATLLVTAAFLLVTLLFGRVWCGWACPQTVLGDLTGWVVPERRARPRKWRRPLGFAAVAAVSLVAGANLVWYFVPPREFLAGLAAGTLGPAAGGFWAALSAILFLDLAFLRATFCATVCPYAKLQGVLFDRSTLVVAYDTRRASDCVDCKACVRVCPTGIDIRDGLQMECIACAECIDACAPVMARLRRAPDLVGYFHGEPGRPARPLRPAALALHAATAAAAVLLGAAVAGRSLLDLSAVADVSFAPRRAPGGEVVSAFSVALENHGRAPVTVTLALASPAGEVRLRPETVPLAAEERRQVRLLAHAPGAAAGGQGELSAVARRGDEVVARRSQRVPLRAPPPSAGQGMSGDQPPPQPRSAPSPAPLRPLPSPAPPPPQPRSAGQRKSGDKRGRGSPGTSGAMEVRGQAPSPAPLRGAMEVRGQAGGGAVSTTMKLSIALAVLAVVGLTVATVVVGAKVREETVVERPYEARLEHEARRARDPGAGAPAAPVACDLGAAPCSTPVPGGSTVTLELSPRPLRTMTDLAVRVEVAGVEPVAVSVSFGMPGMRMGDNVSRLERRGAAWEGKAVLVRCPSGRKEWQADVAVERPGAAAAHAVFPITVVE